MKGYNPNGFGSLPASRSGYATAIILFFAHLLILEYPDHHQNLISSSLCYPGLLHKMSSQSVHNVLSNDVHTQTNRQTNTTKNITSFAKEVISGQSLWFPDATKQYQLKQSISGRSFTSRNGDVITPVRRTKMFYLYTEVKLLLPFNQ